MLSLGMSFVLAAILSRYMTVDGNISSGSVRIHDSVDVFCVRATPVLFVFSFCPSCQ